MSGELNPNKVSPKLQNKNQAQINQRKLWSSTKQNQIPKKKKQHNDFLDQKKHNELRESNWRALLPFTWTAGYNGYHQPTNSLKQNCGGVSYITCNNAASQCSTEPN